MSMKKLNKSELEALGRNVREKLNILIAKEQARLDIIHEDFYKETEDLIMEEFHSLSDVTQRLLLHLTDREELTNQEIRDFTRKVQTKYKAVPRYNYEKMTDALLLAQLENDSLASLITAAVATFTNEEDG